MHPHLPIDMRQYLVPVLECHPEHRVGKGLGDRALDLDGVLLRQAPVPRSTQADGSPEASRNRLRTEANLQYTGATKASSILPGSRPNEVARILPDLVAAAGRIRSRIPRAQFIVARAPFLDSSLFDVIHRSGLTGMALVENETDAALASADVVLTASGTATVQTALHDVPMVVVYRLSPITYRVARRLVKLDSIAMVNLIAGEKIVPELIQDALTPDAVAAHAVSMLTDEARRRQIRTGLARVRTQLGGPGASRRAATAILRVIDERLRLTN